MDELSKCYQALGLKAGSSPDQVKQAYRDLVNVWHPDRFSHDDRLRLIAQEKLKEINGAYEFLKASFFEADIGSSTDSNLEDEGPTMETEATVKSFNGRRAVWMVLVFLVFAFIGLIIFLLEKRSAIKTANTIRLPLAINQTNQSVNSPTNLARTLNVTNYSMQPSGSHALDFDGDKSHVEITTTGSLTGTFTVECWALSKRAGTFGSLVSSRGPKDYSFDMKFADNGIHGDLGDGSNWLATKADVPFRYLQDKWYHIAYVVTPGHYMIYINGVLSASKDDSSGNCILYDANHPVITMAILYPDTESLKGLISEVRIWRTARSAAQIQTDMYQSLTGTESGLQGYWRFNEGKGTIAADSSGHGFSGKLVGNPTWSTNAPPILFLK